MNHFVKFYPDNYTDNVRTPWAGHRLVKFLKSGLIENMPERIGEFWEFSTCSELPSRCQSPFEGEFAALLKEHADIWLSQNHRNVWGNDTPLLIKYIDSDQDLSLQLHPPLRHAETDGNLCGKWESWYVLNAEENAGIYLGLNKGVTRDQFVRTIAECGDVKSLLRFVPVKRGDIFVIPPCTIHALGKGITVLEPQIIVPGKSAVSMRLYDWNRRYDAFGNLSATGKSRKIHFESALPFIEFESVYESEINNIHVAYQHKSEHLNYRCIEFAPSLNVNFLCGTGKNTWDGSGELTAVLVLKGQLDIEVDSEHYHMQCGESGAIAASARHICFDCQDAVVVYMYCLPERFQEMC